MKRLGSLFRYLSFALLCIVNTAIAEVYQALAVSIHDGDTITLQTAIDNKKIRLTGIDAPELKQPFGAESRDALKQDILNQTVTVDTNKQDKYGRSVGKIILNGEDINLKQVSRGMAWVYTDYLKELTNEDQQLYLAAQMSAQEALSGLWKEESPLAPWTFRKQPSERVSK